MKNIKYFISELSNSKYKKIIKKIEYRDGIKQISIDLQKNELYGLFTTNGLSGVIKDLLDCGMILVAHGSFPEKKTFCYKEYDGIYLEYKFIKKFKRGEKNQPHPIPNQEIFFSTLN